MDVSTRTDGNLHAYVAHANAGAKKKKKKKTDEVSNILLVGMTI